ncbi:MAG: UDP-2,3-diacylglucosamine diphosphatase [Burkholderiaceae bacterium]
MTSNPAQPGGPLPARLELPADARVLVASDMHLGDHDPATARWFGSALGDRLGDADGPHGFSHLLLLGDLFEGWAGDDAPDQVSRAFLATLRDIAAKRAVFAMHGNRDFLLDVPLPDPDHAGFTAQTGARLLADPCLLVIGQNRLLIAHGDAYCTDDAAYMAFRAQSRTPHWQQRFLSATAAQRQQTVREMRADSRQHQADASPMIGDVNQAAIDRTMSLAGVATMIHGHTHRPQSHRWTHAGQTRTRHVLSDWDVATARGGFLSLSAQRIERLAPTPPGG